MGLSLQCWHRTGPQWKSPSRFSFFYTDFSSSAISRIFAPPPTVATSINQELATDGAMPKSKISNLANNTWGGVAAHNQYLILFL